MAKIGIWALILAGIVAVAAPAEAGTKVKVKADQMRMVDVDGGEAARAEGNVTIEIPGEVRIEAPMAQLLKGADGKWDRVVFPGSVRITDLRPAQDGQWQSEANTGGYYDFRSGTYTELNPQGVYELTP